MHLHRLLLIVPTFILVFGCHKDDVTGLSSYDDHDPSGVDVHDRYVVDTSKYTSETPLSLAEYKKLLIHAEVNSIENLVDLSTQILGSSVLVYDSNSMHGPTTDALNPRVLSFSEYNSNVVMAWNGKSDFVETMSYEPEDLSFVFNKITFNESGLNISKDNPPECLGCHQPGRDFSMDPDPRPIWDPYPFWFGVYGAIFESERRDVLSQTTEALSENGQSYIHRQLDLESAEDDNLKTFYNTKKNHDRYKYLPEFRYDNIDNFFYWIKIYNPVIGFTPKLKILGLGRQGRLLAEAAARDEKGLQLLEQLMCSYTNIEAVELWPDGVSPRISSLYRVLTNRPDLGPGQNTYSPAFHHDSLWNFIPGRDQFVFFDEYGFSKLSNPDFKFDRITGPGRSGELGNYIFRNGVAHYLFDKSGELSAKLPQISAELAGKLSSCFKGSVRTSGD